MKAVVFDLKGEEGGNGRAEFMAEIFGGNAGVLAANSAGSHEERLGEVGGAFGCFELENPVDHTDLFHATPGVPSDAVFSGGGGQRVDDGFGIVGGREDAAIGLDFQFHALFFKPGDGVRGLETVKGTDEAFDSAGIVCDKFARVVTVVSDITSSATRDADLGKDFRTAFEDEDILEAGLGSRDRSEEACGAASDHDQVVGMWRGTHRAEQIGNFPECNSSFECLEEVHER